MPRRRWRVQRLLMLTTFAVCGCATLKAALDAEGLKAPEVALKDVQLVDVPGTRELSAYFCPRVLGEQGAALGAAASLACTQFFGPAPSIEQMRLAFDVHLNVHNPNRLPLPLASVLTAVTVYPGQEQSQLGAACAQLCGADDKGCAQAACPSDAVDVTQRDEVKRALGQMLIGEGIRLASGQPISVSKPNVLAQESLDLLVRWSLDPQRLLPVLERFARDSARDLQQGKALSFAIPYALEGTVFSDATALGRSLSAPFGPIERSFEFRR